MKSKFKEFIVDSFSEGAGLMFLLGIVIALALGVASGFLIDIFFFNSGTDVSNTPFAQLTFRDLGYGIVGTLIPWAVGIGVFIYAMYLFIKLNDKMEDTSKNLAAKWGVLTLAERTKQIEEKNKEAEEKLKAELDEYYAIPLKKRILTGAKKFAIGVVGGIVLIVLIGLIISLFVK